MLALLTAESQSFEQVAHPDPVVRIHNSIQHWIHCWPDDTNSRWTAVQVEVKLRVRSEDASDLNEKERGPECCVHDCYPEAQLGGMSLVCRSVHSFYGGPQGAKYLQVDHGCDDDWQAVQRRWVAKEGLCIRIKTLVDQQAAVQLRRGITTRKLIPSHHHHKQSGEDAQEPKYVHHQACLRQREPRMLWSQHDIFSMVRQQWEHKIHQGNAEHGKKQADFAHRSVGYKLGPGVDSVDEKHRREEKANQQIGDRQVCDQEVERLADGVVGHIRIDHHTIAKRTHDHG